MLPAYIIEELRRREEAKRDHSRREQPRVELPLPMHRPAPEPKEKGDRGVTIIPIFGS